MHFIEKNVRYVPSVGASRFFFIPITPIMRRVLLLSLLFTFLFQACSDTTTVFEDQDDNLSLETNETVLTSSISYEESGVLDIYDEQEDGGQQSRFLDEQAGDFPLTLVAKVSPPSFSGANNLTATHVDLVGDYAYVSYNTVNEQYAGAIDIIYVGDPNTPRVTSRLYFTNADLSSIMYESNYVYAVGGVDSEQSVIATGNSFIIKLRVDNGRFNLNAGYSLGFQQGFVANDVKATTSGILVTSGKDGYITEYDRNELEIIQEAPFTDLRSVAVNNGQIAVLDASLGVRLLDGSLMETSQIPISADFWIADKRTLAISDDKVVVAEGSNGAGIYDLSSGTLLENVPIVINPEDTAESDIVTNATALNEGALLMANGGAGLCISEENGNFDVVGIIELNGSINYVASKGDYIFAASGREGLQIIKMNKPSNSLEAACSDAPEYSGSSKLIVGTGETQEYSGSKRFNSIQVQGELLLCGTWTVRNGIDVEDDAVFEMRGTLINGRNNRRRDVTVAENGTMRIDGNLTVYGDLILEDNATLSFLGDNATVNIFGDVIIAPSANVTGTFDDIQDKF